ncbi:MAG TPA: outer membrane protein transport protein [Bosea sp. (in: a-proteobacteria)]|uniref:OmpP1/FadL family transporter n=1 Tax=Bosea sp. (in: a-proteobacteria) TaxID=1871050 RepID=UPI002E0E2697|nr:outer membrane protein transport protein [Bosea sp. (in: a-proteobacteria)]
MKGIVRTAAAATVSVAALLAAGAASASSFAIRSGQSAEGLGMAYAGAASGGIGMGSMAWNPATITMFPGRNSNWNFTYLLANGDYQPTRQTTVGGLPIQALGGSPLGTGNIGGDGAFIPASYGNWQLTDRFWVGLTTGAPFGLRSKADNQFYAGQVYGRSAKLGSYNVSPTIGYKVNDWLSVGAAFQIQYLKTTLKNATGANIFQAVGPAAPNQILKGDSIDYGFRVGATLTPWQGTTIGLGYRSSIRQTLEGTISTVAGVAPIKANLNLPDSAVLGISQVINDQWQAHLGVEWTNWSRFRRIPIVSELSGLPISSLNFQYDDSWYFSGALEYKYNQALTLRAGVAYELSAVNDTNRTVFISDNDRLWLSAGASYQVSDKLKLDLGYTYIHVNKATVNYGGTHPQQGPVLFTAEAKPYIHILSAGLTYRWDDPTQVIPAQPVVRKF